VAASAVVIAAGLTAVVVSQASAASGCTVAYQVQTSWNTGATINLNVTNNGPAITSWTVGFTFPGNQQVTNGWNATYTQTGESVTAASLSYNGSLATGGVATLDSPRRILLTFGVEGSARTLVLTGTNWSGLTITETLAVPSGAGATVASVLDYATLTSALPLGGGWTAAATLGR